MAEPFQITINGERRGTHAATLGALAEELGIDPAKIAVERNGDIVARSTVADTPLSDGDVLEIVHFVGGG